MVLTKNEVVSDLQQERVQIPFKATVALKDKLDSLASSLSVTRQGLIEQILIKNVESLLKELENEH